MNVGIIGCGLIGMKRAQTLGDATLVACADTNKPNAEKMQRQYPRCKIANSNAEIIQNPEIDVVIIATPHHLLAEMTLSAVGAGKHVLVEKPAARMSSELIPIIELAEKSGVCVRVGFNHRYHRAFRKARSLISENAVGELMFIRARYGHGGRVGYEKEWRSNPLISGGGELIDQGVHLIDLSRCFLGDFTDISGFSHTYYWDMPVEDNGFLLLKTAKKQTAFLHASCTEWKNTFSFEIYGKTGKIAIEGLGGSYGMEKLFFYKMLPEMGPPETTVWEYPMMDDSWQHEFSEFLQDIKQERPSEASLKDAYAALRVVEQIYEGSL